MTDLQTALVADRLDALVRDGAALRAERERDHLRDHAATGTDAFDHRAESAPRRVRIGRWLVSLGEAVAGSRPPAVTPPRVAAATLSSGDGRDGHHDRWAKAA